MKNWFFQQAQICELSGMLYFLGMFYISWVVVHYFCSFYIILYFLHYIVLLFMQLKFHEDLMACKSNYSNKLSKY